MDHGERTERIGGAIKVELARAFDPGTAHTWFGELIDIAIRGLLARREPACTTTILTSIMAAKYQLEHQRPAEIAALEALPWTELPSVIGCAIAAADGLEPGTTEDLQAMEDATRLLYAAAQCGAAQGLDDKGHHRLAVSSASLIDTMLQRGMPAHIYEWAGEIEEMALAAALEPRRTGSLGAKMGRLQKIIEAMRDTAWLRTTTWTGPRPAGDTVTPDFF